MFDSCLYFNTTALARIVEREWTEAFRPFHLTPAQAFMLRIILEKEALLQRELAEQMAISRPTATRTLNGLQKMKLIERRATRDGREQAIFPTKKAILLKDQLIKASGLVTKRLKDRLSAERFNDIVSEIKSIRSQLR